MAVQTDRRAICAEGKHLGQVRVDHALFRQIHQRTAGFEMRINPDQRLGPELAAAVDIFHLRADVLRPDHSERSSESLIAAQ
ncbi:hypothetical protein FQZ97_576060 [compost metagenome]